MALWDLFVGVGIKGEAMKHYCEQAGHCWHLAHKEHGPYATVVTANDPGKYEKCCYCGEVKP